MADTTQPIPSPAERRMRRLIAHTPSDFRPEQRIDLIHDADLDQVLGFKDPC